jgi:hypothetical protein
MIGVDRIELQRGTTCVKRRGRGVKMAPRALKKFRERRWRGGMVNKVNLNPARKIDLGKHLIPNFTCIGL